jgi:hypothetical protein
MWFITTPTISCRFDEWVSAECCLAALAEPLHRWRPHPSTPLMRRRTQPRHVESANKRMTNLASARWEDDSGRWIPQTKGRTSQEGGT